jgi:hypothetical protein
MIGAACFARYNLNSVSKYDKDLNSPDKYFDNVGAMLGFSFKLSTHHTPYGMTFLKGWWLLDENNKQIWLPLPSQVIKIGKIMTHPVHIVHKSHQVSIDTLAHNISLAYGHVPDNYPILGSFLKMLRKFGQPSNVVIQTEKFEIIFVEQCTVNRAFALDLISYRYGLTISDVNRVENLIASVTKLPVYLEDMAFLRLAETDYY